MPGWRSHKYSQAPSQEAAASSWSWDEPEGLNSVTGRGCDHRGFADGKKCDRSDGSQEASNGAQGGTRDWIPTDHLAVPTAAYDERPIHEAAELHDANFAIVANESVQ
jgi:hypothetical protein